MSLCKSPGPEKYGVPKSGMIQESGQENWAGESSRRSCCRSQLPGTPR